MRRFCADAKSSAANMPASGERAHLQRDQNMSIKNPSRSNPVGRLLFASAWCICFLLFISLTVVWSVSYFYMDYLTLRATDDISISFHSQLGALSILIHEGPNADSWCSRGRVNLVRIQETALSRPITETIGFLSLFEVDAKGRSLTLPYWFLVMVTALIQVCWLIRRRRTCRHQRPIERIATGHSLRVSH